MIVFAAYAAIAAAIAVTGGLAKRPEYLLKDPPAFYQKYRNALPNPHARIEVVAVFDESIINGLGRSQKNVREVGEKIFDIANNMLRELHVDLAITKIEVWNNNKLPGFKPRKLGENEVSTSKDVENLWTFFRPYRERNGHNRDADITYFFTNKMRGGNGGNLCVAPDAWSSISTENIYKNGRIDLNSAELYDVAGTVAHELGHAFGLMHDEDFFNPMYKSSSNSHKIDCCETDKNCKYIKAWASDARAGQPQPYSCDRYGSCIMHQSVRKWAYKVQFGVSPFMWSECSYNDTARFLASGKYDCLKKRLATKAGTWPDGTKTKVF